MSLRDLMETLLFDYFAFLHTGSVPLVSYSFRGKDTGFDAIQMRQKFIIELFAVDLLSFCNILWSGIYFCNAVCCSFRSLRFIFHCLQSVARREWPEEEMIRCRVIRYLILYNFDSTLVYFYFEECHSFPLITTESNINL